MSKRAFPLAVGVLVGPALLVSLPSAAQSPASQAWPECRMSEDLPGGGQLRYNSVLGPRVSWSSGPRRPFQLSLDYGRGAALAPTWVRASYFPRSEPQAASYKVVFDFDGAAQPATLPLEPRNGIFVGAVNDRTDTDLTDDFARARRVTATLFEGDRQVVQRSFELAAPDRRKTGLDGFAQRAQANDPGICGAAAGPPLPVPPVPR